MDSRFLLCWPHNLRINKIHRTFDRLLKNKTKENITNLWAIYLFHLKTIRGTLPCFLSCHFRRIFFLPFRLELKEFYINVFLFLLQRQLLRFVFFWWRCTHYFSVNVLKNNFCTFCNFLLLFIPFLLHLSMLLQCLVTGLSDCILLQYVF